jgi:hypothetical protein
MLVRAVAITGSLAGLVVLLAGCGGSKQPAVASITTASIPATTTSPAGSSVPKGRSSAVLAACLSAHGLSAVVGSAPNAQEKAVALAGVVVTGVDPSSPRFQSALQACRKDMPGGGPPAMSPAQKARWVTAMTAFAGCMRTNGVPSFPDPTGGGTFPAGFFDSLDPSSPQFQSALKTCEPLEPSFGPHIG